LKKNKIYISAPHIANLFSYASYYGSSEQLLRLLLNDKKLDVCDPDNTVTEIEFLKVFRGLLASTNDNYFGLHYGCFLNIKALGFIAQLSLNATSIEQAIFILQTYFKNSFPLVAVEVINEKNNYVLKLTTTITETKLKKHVLDTVFCFLYRELKLMVTDDLLPQLILPYSNNSEYSKSLNTKVTRGNHYCFVFNNIVLETEINKKNAKRIEILLPKFLQMLDNDNGSYKPFSTQVRNMMLNMCCPELPTFEQIAVQLPLSARSIQRKLTFEGLSFRKISDDIKRELSSYLTKGSKMKTQDIAYLLGYSETSAYLHAAKKWKAELTS